MLNTTFLLWSIEKVEIIVRLHESARYIHYIMIIKEKSFAVDIYNVTIRHT